MRRAARILMYVGTAAIVFGLAKYHAAAVAVPPYDFSRSFRLAWSLAYIALLCGAAYGLGLPDLARRWPTALGMATGASAAAALGISVAQLALGSALLPRLVLFASSLLVVPWYVACAALSSGGRLRDESRERVVLVASAEDGAILAGDLKLNPERPATLVATFAPHDAAITGAGERLLVDAANSASASMIVLGREAQSDESIIHQAAELHESGIRVRTLQLFYEEWLGKLPLSELERMALMFDIGELHRARYGRMKRALDIVAGLLALVLLGSLLALVLIGNLAANRGPLFFRQARVGRFGEVFTIFKLRTMRRGPGSTDWASSNDVRITRFGRMLRRSHIDELPQGLNLLKGDLSIVGPRPEQVHYVEDLTRRIPFYRLRHLVRPGMTGWAQVKYHYGANETDAMEKLQYEFYYLRRQSIGLDGRIIVRTIRSVVKRTGR